MTNLWVNKHLREIKIKLGGCQACDEKSPSKLQFAHLKDTPILHVDRDWEHRGRGKWQRYVDIRENPDSYTLLCEVYCHRAFDSGELTIVPKSLLEIQKERGLKIL